MPTAAIIAIADAVPATRNYKPRSISGLTAIHADVDTSDTPAGQSTLELTLKPATNTVARRVKADFALPVEYTDADTGNVTVKDTFRFQGSWVVPPFASAAQVADFEALVRNLVADATFKGYVLHGDAEY
jgi:hypothetical protein